MGYLVLWGAGGRTFGVASSATRAGATAGGVLVQAVPDVIKRVIDRFTDRIVLDHVLEIATRLVVATVPVFEPVPPVTSTGALPPPAILALLPLSAFAGSLLARRRPGLEF